jgi:hypothetical protein
VKTLFVQERRFLKPEWSSNKKYSQINNAISTWPVTLKSDIFAFPVNVATALEQM